MINLTHYLKKKLNSVIWRLLFKVYIDFVFKGKVMIDWKIDSWRKLPIKQVPEYNDLTKVNSVEKELSIRPPLVFAEEARRLRKGWLT